MFAMILTGLFGFLFVLLTIVTLCLTNPIARLVNRQILKEMLNGDRVFARDGYRGVVCGRQFEEAKGLLGLDAPHITNRREMPNGGMYRKMGSRSAKMGDLLAMRRQKRGGGTTDHPVTVRKRCMTK